MTTVEAIQQKIVRLPPQAQAEILEIVAEIEERYQSNETVHPLDLLAEIRIEGPPDLAERHDYYAHGKLED